MAAFNIAAIDKALLGDFGAADISNYILSVYCPSF